MRQVRIVVNEVPRDLLVHPHELLVDTLRERLHLTGTEKGLQRQNSRIRK